MLTILGGRHQLCDGLSRRSFLRVGALGLGGLSLPQLLRAEAQQHAHSHKSIIMVYLPGGPAHQDLYDLKPNAPVGIRGEFKPIKTNIPGIEICELLPRMAAIMDKLAIIRTVVGASPQHDAHQCLTGHARRPEPLGGWPSLGSAVSKLQGPVEPAVPPFVGLSPRGGNGPQADAGSPGFLGLAHAPFQPAAGGRNSITLRGMTLDRLNDRRNLLASFNGLRRGLEQSSEVAGMEECQKRAFEMLTSTRVSEALEVGREDPSVRARYLVPTRKQQGAAPKQLEHFLVARRLIEAGVRCVTLSFGQWDTHSRNFVRLRQDLPLLDQGVATLVQDLHERGLDKDVSVVVWGEFGRSPQVNASAGREHWPRVSCALLAGGGMQTGQVVGATDRYAGAVDDRPVHFQEVFATLYQRLGIDPEATVLTDISGRPQRLVDSGYPPISELI